MDAAPHEPARTAGMQELLRVVAKLRSEEGCPWDREQTLDSLRPYLIEECYEVLDALDSGDPDKHRDELGDLLLQIVLHARIREEEGAFDFDAVAEALTRKLIRRHPHVFSDVDVKDSREVVKNWEAIKAAEKEHSERDSVLDGIPSALPALHHAQRIQSRVARVGFDWDHVRDVIAKIDEELAEVREVVDEANSDRLREEIGDLIFSVVNLARFQGIHAEEALRTTIGKFSRRFRSVEQRAKEQGRSISEMTLTELDELWEAAKSDERGHAH